MKFILMWIHPVGVMVMFLLKTFHQILLLLREHYNEISSKDDGIYVNVAHPSCCINDTVNW